MLDSASSGILQSTTEYADNSILSKKKNVKKSNLSNNDNKNDATP